MPQRIKGKEKEKSSLKPNGLKIEMLHRHGALLYTLQKGSLTVETAVVLPLFLFAMVSILFLFRVLEIQYVVGNSLDKAAAQTALIRNGTWEQLETDTKLLFYRQLLKSEIPLSEIVLGAAGFSWKIQDADKNYLDMTLEYRISLPGWLGQKNKLKVKQGVRCRRWSKGSKEAGTAAGELWVYITPDGTVYHKSRECTHLKLSIQYVSSGRLKTDLKHYRPCEICADKKAVPPMVYVSKEGGCFHTRLDCSGLKRTIYMITLPQAGNRTPCMRCGGK